MVAKSTQSPWISSIILFMGDEFFFQNQVKEDQMWPTPMAPMYITAIQDAIHVMRGPQGCHLILDQRTPLNPQIEVAPLMAYISNPDRESFYILSACGLLHVLMLRVVNGWSTANPQWSWSRHQWIMLVVGAAWAAYIVVSDLTRYNMTQDGMANGWWYGKRFAFRKGAWIVHVYLYIYKL